MLRIEGGAEIEEGAEKYVKQFQDSIKDFNVYVVAVFDAARHFHVHAYTGVSEMPWAVRQTIASLPRRFHDLLIKLRADRTDRFLIETGYRATPIPPFAAIVLGRCKTRDDIVPQIIQAREEFKDYRATGTKYARELRDAAAGGTYADIERIHTEIERGFELLAKKAAQPARDSRLVYRVWDVVKAASGLGILKNAIDKLIDYDVERQTLRNVNGLLDVWMKFQKEAVYEPVLRSKLFPREFHEQMFTDFDEYLELVRRHLPLPTASRKE